MTDMYVLVVCDLGRAETIASELQKIDHVQEVHMLSGLYDIIVKMTGPSTNDLEYAYSKIRHIDGIETTSTLVAYTKYEF
jgi:DNA-binding Lrp family transcriptional regulator